MNRIVGESGRQPLFALAVAVSVGILIGMTLRNSSRFLETAMDEDRVGRRSAEDLPARVQENTSELVRSVGDIVGKFIKE
jgi:hypothetical protein